MKELGFEGLISDAGLFIWRNKQGFVIAVIYVDDALFCGPNKALVQELKEKFMKKWECWDLGDVTKFLRRYTGMVARLILINAPTWRLYWNTVECRTASLLLPLSQLGICWNL